MVSLNRPVANTPCLLPSPRFSGRFSDYLNVAEISDTHEQLKAKALQDELLQILRGEDNYVHVSAFNKVKKALLALTNAKMEILFTEDEANLFESKIAGGIDLSNLALLTEAGEGIQANHANLAGADLTNTVLTKASLMGANLSRASFDSTNLSHADLCNVNLSGSKIIFTNLMKALLYKANFSHTEGHDVNLSGANLSEANLSESRFTDTNFSGVRAIHTIWTQAKLYETVLDPLQPIPGLSEEDAKTEGFQIETDEAQRKWLVGYREKAGDLTGDVYLPGQEYKAAVFNRDPEDETFEPGLYLFPSAFLTCQKNYFAAEALLKTIDTKSFSQKMLKELDQKIEQILNPPLVKVKALLGKVMKAGTRFRTPEFIVIEDVKS